MAHIDDPRDFDAKWNYGDPAATAAAFETFIPAARAGDDPEYLGQLLTQIARTYGLRGEFETAHAVLDEAETVIGDERSVARVRYLLERGRTFNSSGKKAEASALFRDALDQATALGADFYAVDAAHMLAISEPADLALEWNVKAIEMAEGSHSARARGWLGSLYNNTGWTYVDKKDYTAALDFFERNLAFRKEVGGDDAIARWSIAKVQRLLGKFDAALAIQRELLAETEAKNEPDGFVFEEIGECLLAQGDEAGAKPYFARAYELLKDERWIADAEPERLPRMAKLGGVE